MYRSLAASLVAVALVIGGAAVPAQALNAGSAAESSSEAVQPTASPSATAAPTPAPSPSAPVSPKPAPTPSVAPSPQPSASPVPQPTAQPQVQVPVAPPAQPLKKNSPTGDLRGVAKSIPKMSITTLAGNVNGGPGQSVRKFTIEILDPQSKKWLTYAQGTTYSDGFWYKYLDSTTADQQILRLVVEADGTYEKYVGPVTVLNRTKLDLRIFTIAPQGISITTVPWVQKQFAVSITRPVSGITLELQNLRAGKWVTVSKLPTKAGVSNYTMDLPLGNSKSTNTTQTYRVSAAASVNYGAAASDSNQTVRWENPKLYTGMQKTAYGYSSQYCPTVLVRSVNDLKQGRWGEANLGTTEDSYRIYSKVPAQHIRTVALHECSHFHQYKAATNKNNSGGWAAYMNAANRVLGTKGEIGMEIINECMSDRWAKHSYWSYGATPQICAKPAVKSFVQKTFDGQKVT